MRLTTMPRTMGLPATSAPMTAVLPRTKAKGWPMNSPSKSRPPMTSAISSGVMTGGFLLGQQTNDFSNTLEQQEGCGQDHGHLQGIDGQLYCAVRGFALRQRAHGEVVAACQKYPGKREEENQITRNLGPFANGG